jgi:zinc/manganese transport system substrate-binding protein
VKTLRVLALATAALIALSGCGATQPQGWSAGSGPIKIVASTNVWGSVANLVAGDLATVDAIIYNTNQDPHSYELTARDQLLINNADIVIMNGGGYDDFMQQAVDADDTPAITVNAFMASGDDETRNEHIWYDVDQVGDVAAVIGAAIESVDESKFEQVEASVSNFRAKLAERKKTLNKNIAMLRVAYVSMEQLSVFLTEPLVEYLVEDAGFRNATSAEFSEAVEEDRDIPPAVMKEAIDLIKRNGVGAIFVNSSTQTAQIDTLLAANPKMPVFGFSELLIQDPDTLEYDGGYFEMLDAAIETVISR